MGKKASNKPYRKATRAERAIRLSEIKQMLLNMRSRPDIVRHAAKLWGLEYRQTDVYIKWANEEIQQVIGKDKRKIANQIIAAQMDLYQLAKDNGDLPVARGLLMDIAKIAGVNIDHVIMEHRELNSLPEEELTALESALEDSVSFHN